MAYNKKNKVKEPRKFNSFQYLMSKEMAEAYLKARKGEEEKRMHPQAYLIKVVNEEFNLLRECTQVNIY